MLSSGMLRYVTLVRTVISEEHIASIIRVTRFGDLGTALAVTSNRSMLRYIPEDGILYNNRSENLKCYIALTDWAHQWRYNVSP
jgi:hypothetical protein